MSDTETESEQYLSLTVIFYRPESGGRSVLPVLNDGQYRPHLVMNDDPEETYLGVQFVKANSLACYGMQISVLVRLPYEGVDYSGLEAGSEFQIREGRMCVGEGRVNKA